MYLHHFSLTGYPFDNTIEPDELYQSIAAKEAAKRIDHLLDLRGIGLITGESGCGKTSVCHQVVERLHPGRYQVIYVSLTTGSVLDTLNTIALGLGLPEQRQRGAAWRVIRSEIERLGDEKNLLPVLIIDEAHYLRNDTLEDLRLISNFDFDSNNRLCLMLVAMTDLRHRLKMAVHESLTQRLVMNHHFGKLAFEELQPYLNHRLQRKGAAELEYFSPVALEALYQGAQGVLRQINRLAHYTLISAASTQAQQATEKHVEIACQEVRL